MPRRGALVTLTLALAVALTAWWLATSDGGEGRVAPLAGEAPEAEGEVVLPAVGGREPVALEARVADLAVAEGSASTATPLTIVVHHAHGAPAVGARVGLFTQEMLFRDEGVLDAEGVWRRAGFDAAVSVFVVGVTPEPVRFELEVARGEHAFTLPEGGVITGRVLVDGAPVSERFPLAMTCVDPARRGERPPRSPIAQSDRGLTVPALRSDLAAVVGDGARRGFFTAADGTFTVSGLPARAEVYLYSPGEWRLDDELSPMPLLAPAADFVLHVRSPTVRLCGRVVDELGAPVPHAPLRLRQLHTWAAWDWDDELEDADTDIADRVWFLSGGTWERARIATHADAHGRFCFAPTVTRMLPHAPPGHDPEAARHSDRIEVLAYGPGDLRARVELVDPDGEHELGDLVLRPTPHHVVRVVDEFGRVAVDVPVRIDHEEPRLAFVQRTDVLGRTTVEVGDVGFGTLTIAAPGYDTARVVLPELPTPEPIVVQLVPTAALTVRVTWPPSFEREREYVDWSLELEGPVPVFRDGLLPAAPDEFAPGPSGLRTWLGARPHPGEPSTPGRVLLEARSGTTIQLEGLRPHNPVTPRVFLRNAPGIPELDAPRLVWTGDALWLEPGEDRMLSVDLRGLALER